MTKYKNDLCLGVIEENSGSIKEVILVWQLWPVMITLLIATLGLGFLEPTLSIHLEKVGFTKIIDIMIILQNVIDAFRPKAGWGGHKFVQRSNSKVASMLSKCQQISLVITIQKKV